jgi:hypothetical protein
MSSQWNCQEGFDWGPPKEKTTLCRPARTQRATQPMNSYFLANNGGGDAVRQPDGIGNGDRFGVARACQEARQRCQLQKKRRG